jgi:FkbM family methyltransferase
LTWGGRSLAYADPGAAFQQLHEIFNAKVYDFKSATPNPRIIDCGAHTGFAVIRWRELFPAARIVAIEADPDIARLLSANLAAGLDRQTEVMAAAAWTHDGEIRFSPTGRDNGLVTPDGSRVVPAVDLARLCGETVDLLKMDIEGAEAPVIAHLAATGALRRIRALICEWHEWEDAPRLHVALAQLAAAGFTYRLTNSDTLGDTTTAVFPQLKHPGNQLMIYAWQS